MAERKMALQWVEGGECVRALLRDLLAGLVGSVALIANVVSFAALMFPGALSPGASVAVWAMLVGGGTFLLRTLSDRINVADHMVAALAR